MTTVIGCTEALGPLGMRPAVVFSPGSPQNPAGMRIEPPPSPPVASAQMPAATADAEPPELPPGVAATFQALPVMPFSRVFDTLRPPNSLAVVNPKGTAPPRSSVRATLIEVSAATSSANSRLAWVAGQPA